jgi:hypothetical protein
MREHLGETILGRKLRKLYNHSGWEIKENILIFLLKIELQAVHCNIEVICN